jgi:serine protease Do
MNVCNWPSRGLWGLLIASCFLFPLRADEPSGDESAGTTAKPSAPADAETPNGAETDDAPLSREVLSSEILSIEMQLSGRSGGRYSRNDPSVLRAFREVVAAVSKSTVKVFCDDKQVAFGAILDAQGHIATKGSQLNGNIVCELADGSRQKAMLLGLDRLSDLAVLQINAENLPVIAWRATDSPEAGSWVVTSGPSDLPQAIGIVSVAPHAVRGGVLGIQLAEDKPGPRINFLVPGGGAAAAGLQRGDIITHINDKAVESVQALVVSTGDHLPGEVVNVTILRGKEVQKRRATLGSLSRVLAGDQAQVQERLGGPLSERRDMFRSVLEHDTILLPEECGGPLVDLRGEVVGINIARASRVSTYAIPTRVAREVLETMMNRATIPVSNSTPPVSNENQ